MKKLLKLALSLLVVGCAFALAVAWAQDKPAAKKEAAKKEAPPAAKKEAPPAAKKEAPPAAKKGAAAKKEETKAGSGEPIDINSASKEQLMKLKGIGPAYSDRIIKNRPYKGKDDLANRKIIPQATYDKIKDQLVARQK